MTLDLVISGGTVVTAGGMHAVDLGISAGKVVVWAERDAGIEGNERIDATGLLVLPGLVDAHVHMREPGLAHKEGFATGSMAAAAGGVTTVLVMPTDNPPTMTPAAFREKRALAKGQCRVDFGLQVGALDPASLAELASLGATSVELFLGDIGPDLLVPDSGMLLAILEEAARLDLVVGITPADEGAISAAVAREKQGTDRLAFFRSRPAASEVLGIARACAAAALSGAVIHIRQVSTAASVQILAAMRPHCRRLTSEVMTHNLFLTEDEIERQGAFAKVLPPLRTDEDVRALWVAVTDGTIDIVASDHAPHLPEEKTASDDIWQVPGGLPGLQTTLPMLAGAVAEGRLDWPGLVRLCSERPARLFGLFPAKGSLTIGADADVVLVDPKAERTISDDGQLSKARRTPFAGRRVSGWPVRTLLGGRTIMREGAIEGEPSGRMVSPSRG